jgi:hypothetical protein
VTVRFAHSPTRRVFTNARGRVRLVVPSRPTQIAIPASGKYLGAVDRRQPVHP